MIDWFVQTNSIFNFKMQKFPHHWNPQIGIEFIQWKSNESPGA